MKDYSDMEQTENFHRIYIEPNVDFKTYKNVVIMPVDTSHLPEYKWYNKKYNGNELEEITEHIEREFAMALGDNYLIVKEHPHYAVKTMILELALVDLVPVNRPANVATSIFIFLPFSKGRVAIEGHLIDADTGKTLLKFMDARRGKENLGNIKDFARFGHVKHAIEEWAREIDDIMQMGEAEREGHFGGIFEVKPW